MSRGAELELAAGELEHVELAPRRSWIPRARRIPDRGPILYRAANESNWHSGTLVNISQTGVLFEGEELLLELTEVGMMFEMPKEICGQNNCRVHARGKIVRSALTKDEKAQMAVAMDGYSILRDQ
jgi:hypothetical protein